MRRKHGRDSTPEGFNGNSRSNVEREFLDSAKQQSERKVKKKTSFFSKEYWTVWFGIFLLTFGLAAPVLYILITRLGFGRFFPNQSQYLNMKPLLPESSLEIVGELPFPPGNIAISSEGRIFFTFHPEYNPPYNVAELHSRAEESVDASFTPWSPYPSKEFQKWYRSVLSMRIDRLNRLWLLDFAHHAIQHSPSLFAFELAAGQIHKPLESRNKDTLFRTYSFPKDIAGFGSMLNDFQVDPTGDFLYIVDTSILSLTPAIIIYSVAENRAYRILQGHSSLFGPSTILQMYAHPGLAIRFGPFGMQIHADSFALDRTGSRLYYGSLTGNELYSISTSFMLAYVRKLQSFNITYEPDFERKLYEQIHLVSTDKPVTDGLTTDNQGNIWMTGVEHSSVFVGIPKVLNENSVVGVTDSHSLEILKVVSSPSLLRWPDGFSFGPDGLYVTNSALHYKFTQRNVSQHRPFHILRLPNRELEQLKLVYRKRRFQSPVSGH